MTTGKGRVPGKTRRYLRFLQPGHLRVHHLQDNPDSSVVGPSTAKHTPPYPPPACSYLAASSATEAAGRVWYRGSPPGDVEPVALGLFLACSVCGPASHVVRASVFEIMKVGTYQIKQGPKYDMDAYMASLFGGEAWHLCWESGRA